MSIFTILAFMREFYYQAPFSDPPAAPELRPTFAGICERFHLEERGLTAVSTGVGAHESRDEAELVNSIDL